MSAYYCDNEPYVVEWSRNLISAGHIAPGVVDGRSIKEVVAGDVRDFTQAHFFAGIGVWSYALRLAGWPDDVPVWTGSCPCQPFSAAGRKRGITDERHLWPEWFRLIRQQRPPVIFGEQVASADGLKWLDAVSSDLEGAGYAFGAADLCAAGVGAPHLRQRLFFVAYATEQRWDSWWRSSMASDGRAAPRLEPRRLREAHELADAHSGARDEGRALGGGGDRGGDAQSRTGPRSGGSAVELADSSRFDQPQKQASDNELRKQRSPFGRRAEFLSGLGAGSRDGGRDFAPGAPGRGNAIDPRALGRALELANADRERLEERLQLRPRGPRADLLEALRHGEARGLGHADSVRGSWYPGADARAQSAGAGGGLVGRRVGDEPLAAGEALHVGDASGSRLAGRASESGDDGAQREAAERAGGATGGSWADAQWLYCLDGKWRPTEPGVEPLAHGSSGRVAVVRSVEQGGSQVQETHWYSRIGSIKGYGNAIVGPVAATFIRAFMDVVAGQQNGHGQLQGQK